MTITIFQIPPSLNEFLGRNEWNYRGAKQHWTTMVFYKCIASKDRPDKPYERADVKITYYFADKRRHDADNYCGKLFMDGIVKAGVIADDDFSHITVKVVGRYDKDCPRTEIEITESYTEGDKNGEK